MLQRLRPDITADEYAALLEVKGLVAEGKIVVRMASCVECIGGHMAKVMGRNPGMYVTGQYGPLRALFYPSSLLFCFLVYRKKQTSPRWLVLRAIDRFLAGHAPWQVS